MRTWLIMCTSQCAYTVHAHIKSIIYLPFKVLFKLGVFKSNLFHEPCKKMEMEKVMNLYGVMLLYKYMVDSFEETPQVVLNLLY